MDRFGHRLTAAHRVQDTASIFHKVDAGLHTASVLRGHVADPKSLPAPKDIDGIHYMSHAKYHDGCIPLRELLQADNSGVLQIGAVIFQTVERYGLYVVGMIRRTPASLDPRRHGVSLAAIGDPADFLMQLTVCKASETGERRVHYVSRGQLEGVALINGHPFVKDIPHIASVACFAHPIVSAERGATA